jgi:hypothetical protein
MKRHADRPDCKLLRIETSQETPPRKRYICACGYDGSWEKDRWRHVGFRSHWYTAARLATWNWRAHAGIRAACKKSSRRKQVTAIIVADTAQTRPLLVNIEPSLLQRIINSAQATGRTLQEFVRDTLLQSVNSASIPAGIKPGVVVEWEPEYAHGTMRAVITRVVDGRVFVTIERRHPTSTRRRKPDPETWFEPDEVHRLRVVPIADGSGGGDRTPERERANDVIVHASDEDRKRA